MYIYCSTRTVNEKNLKSVLINTNNEKHVVRVSKSFLLHDDEFNTYDYDGGGGDDDYKFIMRVMMMIIMTENMNKKRISAIMKMIMMTITTSIYSESMSLYMSTQSLLDIP